MNCLGFIVFSIKLINFFKFSVIVLGMHVCAFTQCVVTCVFAHMDPSGKKDDLELVLSPL